MTDESQLNTEFDEKTRPISRLVLGPDPATGGD